MRLPIENAASEEAVVKLRFQVDLKRGTTIVAILAVLVDLSWIQ